MTRPQTRGALRARTLCAHLLLGALVSAATLSPISLAHAEVAPLAQSLTGDAKSDYDSGRLLYLDGDFAGAALKFTQAYKKSHDPRLLWNAAAAYKSQRRYATVERFVKQYLTEAPSLTPADRAEAEELLKAIQPFIANLTVTVNEAQAAVLLDGVEVGRTPLPEPLRVDMGPHQVRVTKPGFEASDAALELTDSTMLSINLSPASHVGRLRITSPADATVYVDGKRVTGGVWEGTVSSGAHHVRAQQAGNPVYEADTLVRDDESTALQISAQDLRPASKTAEANEGGPTWLWVTAGILLAGGAAAGGYYLFRPDTPQAPLGEPGSIGLVEL